MGTQSRLRPPDVANVPIPATPRVGARQWHVALAGGLVAMVVLASLLATAQPPESKGTQPAKGGETPWLTRPAEPAVVAAHDGAGKWLQKQRSSEPRSKHVEPVLVEARLLQDRKKLKGTTLAAPFRLMLYLTPETQFMLVVEKGKLQRLYDEQEFWTWRGRLDGIEGSAVTLSCTQAGLVNGSIRTPDESYQIRPVPPMKDRPGEHLHAIVQLGDEGLPAGQSIAPPNSGPTQAERDKKKEK